MTPEAAELVDKSLSLSPFSNFTVFTQDASALLLLISLAVLIGTVIYLWKNGLLYEYIIYYLLNGAFFLVGLTAGVLAFVILFALLGGVGFIIGIPVGLALALIPPLWYKARLTSLPMALLWIIAVALTSLISLGIFVDAWFFTNVAGGDFW